MRKQIAISDARTRYVRRRTADDCLEKARLFDSERVDNSDCFTTAERRALKSVSASLLKLRALIEQSKS